jgi:alkylhydroperoxidase/carboxymuconolactone decarboxylase family protein YurZ
MLEFAQDVHSKYREFVTTALNESPLEEREKALVVLSAALIQGNPEEVNEAIHIAKQSLISNEEIGRVIGILLTIQSERFLQFTEKEGKQVEDSTCCR